MGSAHSVRATASCLSGERGSMSGGGGGAPSGRRRCACRVQEVKNLAQLLGSCEPAKRKAVVAHLTKELMPVVEKALLHPPMTHRRDGVEMDRGGRERRTHRTAVHLTAPSR